MARRALPLAGRFGPTDVISAAQAVTARAFAERRSVAKATAIAEDAGAWADDLIPRVAERLPPSAPIACREGCAFCCHLKVLATAPEVLRIADHLRATRDAAALQALRDRIAVADDQTRGMTTDDRARAKRACALLVDGRCAAYEARPLACRGANSLDAARCEQGFERPDEEIALPVYKPQLQLAEALRAGLSGGAARSGLDGRPLELHAALRIALESPDAGAAWARGKPSFAAAIDAEMEEALRGGGRRAIVTP